MIVGLGPAAVGGSAGGFDGVPCAAADDFEGAGFGPCWIGFCFGGICAEPVFAPFLDVSAHVVASDRADAVDGIGGIAIEVSDWRGERE